MNYIISIGYRDYFLKGDAGIGTLMKRLSEMKEIETEYVGSPENRKRIHYLADEQREIVFKATTEDLSKLKKPAKFEEVIDDGYPDPGSGLKLLSGRKAIGRTS
jgi:hypothetical protein